MKEFKSRKISIFNFHVPLDNFGKYSTSVSLANKLGIKSDTAFGPYFGALCGVYGKTEIKTMKELKEKYELTVGHEVKYYNYGENRIDGKVAIVAGGGLSETIEEIAASGVKVFITGITAKNEFSEPAHTYAKIE
jgi:putative NIF3 family GTP cyclohydrolase 1 type 2